MAGGREKKTLGNIQYVSFGRWMLENLHSHVQHRNGGLDVTRLASETILLELMVTKLI